MKLNVFWHPDVLLHDTGTGVFEAVGSDLLTVREKHPEGTDRISNMLSILKRGPLSSHLTWHWGRQATEKELQLFHTPAYVSQICAAERGGARRLTATTLAAPGSYDACRAAAGTALEAAAFVMQGQNRIAYALVRPPGHHAAPAQADGYCLFNNVAVAVEYVLQNGVDRIAVVDWDVHHGNGTQTGFFERNNVLTISLHMDHGAWGPSHPETGDVDEVGQGPGRGFNLNIPLPMGTGDAGYLYAFEKMVIPAIDAFEPDMLVVACGQDASQFDADGRQLVTMQGFRQMGAHVRRLADRHSNGRLLLVQEGGYAVSYAPFCLHATLEGVLGLKEQLPDPLAYLPDDEAAARKNVDGIIRRRQAVEPPI